MMSLRVHNAFALLLGTLSVLPGVLRAEFEEKVLPVPMLVEVDEVFTDLHLDMQVEELGFPLLGRSQNSDTDLERMLSFFDAVLTEQVGEAVEMTKPVRDLPPESGQQVIEAYAELLTASGGDVQIERVVELGYDRLLIWSMALNEPGFEYPRLVRSFRFLRDGPDGDLYFEGARRDPLSILITSMYHEGQLIPGGLEDASSRDFEYGYDFPLENNGEAPRLVFDGAMVDAELFHPSSGVAEPDALAFYRQAMDALATGDPAVYAPFFSDFSRERFETWVAQMEPGAYAAFRQDTVTVGKNVYFVLNADPVFFLLHLPTYEGISGASFRYDVVWRNPAGRWEIVNFYTEGFFDDIIKHRGLFEEPFLRPLLVSAGLIEDERKELAVVPVATPPAVPPTATEPSARLADQLPVAVPTGGDRQGLPRWVWGLVVLVLLLLGYAFWRQNASSADANTPSS